jgi:hypothetical protein
LSKKSDDFHWVPYRRLDEEGFKRFIASTLLESLMRDFPEETKAVLTKLG